MTVEYIRRIYGVPAKKGGRVIFDGKPGVITGYHNQYLRVRLDGKERTELVHPHWHMEYVTVDWAES